MISTKWTFFSVMKSVPAHADEEKTGVIEVRQKAEEKNIRLLLQPLSQSLEKHSLDTREPLHGNDTVKHPSQETTWASWFQRQMVTSLCLPLTLSFSLLLAHT